MVVKSKHPHAFVSPRVNLMHRIILSPPNTFYLPPESEDATFSLDPISMVMSKKFPYIKQFNHL